MVSILIGVFIVLHGLVHFWFVALSQRLVPVGQEVGWSGVSWAFSGLLGDSSTRALASGLFGLAAVALVASGTGVVMRQEWSRALLSASAVFSSAVILLFWDGRLNMPVEKGLLGLLINVAILAAPLLASWPAEA